MDNGTAIQLLCMVEEKKMLGPRLRRGPNKNLASPPLYRTTTTRRAGALPTLTR